MMKRRTTCRICGGTSFDTVIPLGPAPLANAYKDEADLENSEPYYPLTVYRCRGCGLVQLRDIVDAETLFDQYDYFTGQTSESFPAHFTRYADDVLSTIDVEDPFIVGIGSNDGTLLQVFQERGATVLGVDPAENVAEYAREHGVETLPRFFGEAVAGEIREEHGPADVVVANNVLGHVDDLHSVIGGVERLLSESGHFFAEVPYLRSLLDGNEFDTVYHEHRSYVAVKPLQRLFSDHSLGIVDVQEKDVHGGSIRIHAQKGRDHAPSTVGSWIDAEEEDGLYTEATYTAFAKNIERIRHVLTTLVRTLTRNGHTIAGYGAPAKASVLLNYCNLDDSDISFVTDAIPQKQGKYLPGTRIPIRPPEAFPGDADYSLMFAWNYRDEILQKERSFLEAGGTFILPHPRPTLVSLNDAGIVEQEIWPQQHTSSQIPP